MNERIPLLTIALMTILSPIRAEEHHHHADGDKPVQRPRIFLDKNLKIVQYQLKRLDNERLLLVERKSDDKKYAPVFTAILTRAGMSPQYREEALAGLVELNKSDATSQLLTALEKIDPDDRQQLRTGRQLAAMLIGQPASELMIHVEALRVATESDNSLLRSSGYAALVTSGRSADAWSAAQSKPGATLDWLAAVSLIPKPEIRAGLREQVAGLIDASHPDNVRLAAIQAIAFVPSQQDQTFELVAPLAMEEMLQPTAIRTMLQIPAEKRGGTTSRQLADFLVKQAEETPAAERTTDDFIDAMQLADQLLAKLPVEESRSYRERLRAITVRVVRVQTVEEEMRYDLPYFAVEAGRPVQVILQNEDLMPHNLVITMPDALKEVAQLGLAIGPDGFQGKQYVPESDKVLHATGMVQPHQQQRLTFTAPKEPGEYPYVCTFPRHWMRMYGVMVVVPDLDEWSRNPTKPKDPIGSNREFVKAWTLDDFTADFETGLRGRSTEIGHRLFTEATCAQCHKLKGMGGGVGPELTEVFKRWKGDRLAVLREILEPSHRIDPKYAVHVIYTLDGKVLTGIVTAEDKTSVSLLDNPEAPKPKVIPRNQIDEMLKTSKSMMPKALLDRFSKDEVFEILALLEGLATN